MESPLFLSILAFAAMALLFAGLNSYARYHRERQEFKQKVERMADGPLPETPLAPSLPRRNVKEYTLRFFRSLGGAVKPKNEGELSRVRKTFLRAGYRGPNTSIVYFGVKAVLAMLLPVFFSLVKVALVIPISSMNLMTFAVLLALIGFYLPDLWLRGKIARRKEQILKGFPDALDLMVVCVEAGLGLDAAINRVGEEMRISHKALSEEFKLLGLELRAGKSRGEALRNLAVRTDLEDVNSLVTLLIQTDRFGTSVAQALRVHSDSMRTKRHQRSQEIAAKLPVKLLFPLIFFIFPSLFVVILGPAVIRVYRILLPTLGRQ